MDFELSFTPRNMLPTTGLIKIQFPVIFILDTSQTNTTEIQQGLEHISKDNTITIGPDAQTSRKEYIEIKNFVSVPNDAGKKQEIKISMRATTPDKVGVSPEIQIYTYND